MNTVAISSNRPGRRANKPYSVTMMKILFFLLFVIVSKGALAAVTNCTVVPSPQTPQKPDDIVIVPPVRVTPGTPANQALTDWVTYKTAAAVACKTTTTYQLNYELEQLAQIFPVVIDGQTYKALGIDTTNSIGVIAEYYDSSKSKYMPLSDTNLSSTLNRFNVSGDSSYEYDVRYRFVSIKQISGATGPIAYISRRIASGAFCEGGLGSLACYAAAKGVISSGLLVSNISASGNIAPLTCSFAGTGANGGTDNLANASLGTNFNTSSFSAGNPGNWVSAGMKLDAACNADQIEATFTNGPGYTSPAGNANDFGAKVNGAADPSVGVELRRKDNAQAIKPNDTATWNQPFAAGADFVEARLVKVGTGTPLVGNGTSFIQATMTYY